MAWYDYFCDDCGKPFEIQAGMSDDREWVRCRRCEGANIRRTFDSIIVPKKSSAGSGASSGGGGSCSSCTSSNCGSCG